MTSHHERDPREARHAVVGLLGAAVGAALFWLLAAGALWLVWGR